MIFYDQANVFVNDCGPNLLCTCAVSVRVGNDVIRVGNCDGSLTNRRPLLKQLFYTSPVNKDFKVVSRNSGDSITVRSWLVKTVSSKWAAG